MQHFHEWYRRSLGALTPLRAGAAPAPEAPMTLPPSLLMVAATLLFATMGVCVKLASAQYAVGEIVFYRGLIGALSHRRRRARSAAARCAPAARRCMSGAALIGVCSLGLWFYAIGQLPLATAMTLNYMSSVWMALFLVGGAVAARRPAASTRG